MVEACQHPGFAFEALQHLRIKLFCNRLFADKFDRHIPFEGRIEGFIDHSHTPGTQLLDDPIFPDNFSNEAFHSSTLIIV